MDVRRFFILETLLSNGDSTEQEVMGRLWTKDEISRESRNEPWAWYYNTTKCFSKMEEKGWIELVEINKDNRKVWSISIEGSQAFVDEIESKNIFKDTLYQKRKKSLAVLAASAI